MNPELITRLVKLVEKTGDRVILPDLESGKAVVVMDLDAYERMCVPTESQQSPQIEQAPEPAASIPAPQVIERESAPKIADRIPSRESVAKPVSAAVEAREGRPSNKPADKVKNRGLEDLTQKELLDRINRDIDEWKNAQDAKSVEDAASASHDLPAFATAERLEEEERFFLEPIE